MKKFFMKFSSCLTHSIFLLALQLLPSCTHLPDYARPQFNPMGYSQEVTGNSFGYRHLTIKDFQADFPPTDSVEQNNHIQARSCIHIRPSQDIKAYISNSSVSGKRFYIGNISDVGFEARFLPHCSWWNPKVSKKKRAYVLEHEQIHFAIAELAAKELTRKAGAEIREYIAFGETREEVRDDLSEKLQSIATKSTRESLHEHLSFDNDTSMVHAPKVQAQWLKEVEGRITATRLQQEPLKID